MRACALANVVRTIVHTSVRKEGVLRAKAMQKRRVCAIERSSAHIVHKNMSMRARGVVRTIVHTSVRKGNGMRVDAMRMGEQCTL